MAIDVSELRSQPLDTEIEEELRSFEDGARRFMAGEIDDDVFRVFRLNQGIYGQRQGGFNQMVRVKIPYGRVEPDQLEMFGHLAENYSRGWAHLTTRQNVQFHFVQLETAGEVLRLLASVGLTSREACGDTVRNVAGCHLAGACPYEVLDISPWAEAAKDLFLRNPISQRLPRKFKINFSGCATDCGQAMFNDVGVIAVNRPRPDGTVEPGFKVFMAGGLGANPHPAQALEEFTTREDLLPTIEAILRVEGNYGNRDNKLRAAVEVARRHHGDRRAPRTHPQGAQVPPRVGHVPRWHPRHRRARRRRTGRHRHVGERRRWPVGNHGHPGRAPRPQPARTVGHRQRRARARQRHRERVRVLPSRRHHRRPVPRPRPDPA